MIVAVRWPTGVGGPVRQRSGPGPWAFPGSRAGATDRGKDLRQRLGLGDQVIGT